MKPIAVQLYTLRDEAEKDFPGVLRRVADIGYKGVEMAGLYGRDAREIGSIVADLGIQVCSSHSDLPNSDNIGNIVEMAQALGTTRIISGLLDEFETIDECKQSASRFSNAAALLNLDGISFAFHNHWQEFAEIDGKYAYDIVMNEAPNVCSELDVYWAAFAGADPVEVISKYKSRLPVLHIKDGDLNEPRLIMTAVGSGAIPIPKIIGAADASVLEWLVVELDGCAGDVFEAVRASYEYLTYHGLAVGNK